MAEIKKPAIRFKGFSEAWEQRRLSKITTMHARIGWQNLRKSEFLDSGDYYLITGTDFVDGEIDLRNCHYVTQDRYEQDSNIQISNGSILITKDGTLGKVAYVKGLDKPATLNAGVFNVVTSSNDVDGKYLFQYLKAPFLMDYVAQKATGGTIKHLNQNILVEFPVVLPNKEEQQKIGKFFTHLDHLITLNQHKLEKLKNIKKAMLEKMFPKNGENIPEIRFKGFSEAWEQRKFSDIAQRLSATGMSSADLPSVEYEDVISEQGLLNKDVTFKGTQKTGIVFSAHNVLYGKLRPYLHNWLNPDFKGVAVGDWWVLNPINSDKNFIYRLIQSENFDTVANQSTGTKMPRADWKLVSMTEFSIPTSLEEQQQIGTFFRNLDTLIALHQRELEKLKNIKKSMLEKMFP